MLSKIMRHDNILVPLKTWKVQNKFYLIYVIKVFEDLLQVWLANIEQIN